MDEVIDVMQENITKVIERGERLDELQDKSGTDTSLFLVLLTCVLIVYFYDFSSQSLGVLT